MYFYHSQTPPKSILSTLTSLPSQLWFVIVTVMVVSFSSSSSSSFFLPSSPGCVAQLLLREGPTLESDLLIMGHIIKES